MTDNPKPDFSWVTNDQIEALRWFLEREPAAGLDVSMPDENGMCTVFPTDQMRTHLCKIGLLERFEKSGMYRFRTTPDGRAALEPSHAPPDSNGMRGGNDG